jgi:hypothetical protein
MPISPASNIVNDFAAGAVDEKESQYKFREHLESRDVYDSLCLYAVRFS